MAYVSYSTPTRHVESSYLLNKPVQEEKRPTVSCNTVGGSTVCMRAICIVCILDVWLFSTQSQGEASPGHSAPVPDSTKSGKRKPRPQATPPPVPVVKTKQSQGQSSVWSSLLSFALLVVMFVVTFLAYDHYTAQESLLTSMLTRAASYLREAGILQHE